MRTASRLAFTRPRTRPLMVATLLLAGACATDPLPGEADGDTSVTTGALAISRAPSINPGVTINPLPPVPPPPPPEPLPPTTQALESGAGWRRVKVNGNAEDFATGVIQPVSDEFYVIDGRGSINNTSLPASTRQVVSAKLTNMAMPAAGDDEIIIVPKALNDAIQSNVAFYSICDDSNYQTFSKTYTFDKSYNYHRNSEPGALAGSGDFQTRLKGSVTGIVRYSIRYHYCIPTFILHRVIVRGDADVVATASLVATFQKKWSWETQVAAPVLGTVSFFGIPVTFKAPISVGIDAQAAASLNFNGTYEAHGSFDIHCSKRSGCDGDKEATSGFTSGGAPAFSASGMVKVVPWAQGAIRAYVIDEGLIHAQVGVRAKLAGELWGYTGNTCGDANNDGVNEYVSGASLDLGVGIDVVAKAGIFGSDLGPWSWNVWNQHLAFWGTGDALDPIFYGKGCGGTNLATMHVAMRPCWPYNDAVTYRMTWGDGTTSSFSGHPDTRLTQTHAYATTGAKSIRVDALRDAKGRDMAGDATRTVNVSFLPVVCFDDLELSQ
jgi:hypothetical protein